jgi:4-oxalocrotonate tautomerase
MPMITLQLSRPLDAETRLAVTRALTDLTAEILGKKRELTALAIGHGEHWSVGAEAVGGALTAFHLEVRITAGTNTKPEKANYLSAVWQSLDELVGPLHPASYIVVSDLAADSWGYAGETQELRHVRARLAQ